MFQKVRIPDLGKDAIRRQSFTGKELNAIAIACREKDDDLRWIVALMIDTGARLAEVVGLRLEDIHTKGKVPFIAVASNEARHIKTAFLLRPIQPEGQEVVSAKHPLIRKTSL